MEGGGWKVEGGEYTTTRVSVLVPILAGITPPRRDPIWSWRVGIQTDSQLVKNSLSNMSPGFAKSEKELLSTRVR